MKKHVVVVLSYFGKLDTLRCVESIIDGDPEVEPLVVDNGSFDGTVEESIARWGEDVPTLQLDRNTGFTGGMNSGIRWAIAQGAEIITILNNDTVIQPRALSRSARTARQNGAAVAPEIRYWDAPDRIWFAGGTIDARTGLARHLRQDELTSPDTRGLRSAEILTGCCITAPTLVWQRVGLLDDRYFLNFEDSDWSVRAREVGVPLIVDTRAVIKHRVSASFTGAFSYLGLYFYARNGVTFVVERSGSGGRAAPLFLRRHLLPVLRPRAHTGGIVRAMRRTLVLAYAGRDVLLRRFGPAPAGLEKRAARWAEMDSAGSRHSREPSL